jgi:hypothetical protein
MYFLVIPKLRKGQSKLDNPETLATLGIRDEEKHRETGNIGYTRRRKTKQTHNAICVEHHYVQINTHNVNKT